MVTATSSPTVRGRPCRGAGEDDVAGQQRHGLRDVDDQVLDGVDHLAGAAQLALLAVDGELHGEVVGTGEVQVGLHPGAERAGAVEALGPGPLLLAALDVTGGDVVGAGVAEDHVLDALAGHLPAHAADDDGQLGLVVQLLRERRVLDLVTRTDDRGGRLEEGERGLGHLVAQLPRVFRVVAAERHDLVGEDRGEQPDLAQRHLRPGQLVVGEGDALDDVEDEFVLLVALDRAEGYVPVDGEPGDAHGCLRPSLRTGVLTPKVNRSGGPAFGRERMASCFPAP